MFLSNLSTLSTYFSSTFENHTTLSTTPRTDQNINKYVTNKYILSVTKLCDQLAYFENTYNTHQLKLIIQIIFGQNS